MRRLPIPIIIPRRKNSIKGNKGLDWHLYKLRHLVENAFARLKHYRAVATRYDKLARNYESIVSLACAFLWLIEVESPKGASPSGSHRSVRESLDSYGSSYP